MKRLPKIKKYLLWFVIIALIVVSVLGGGLGEALGLGFLAGPVPVISFAAETVFYIGGFAVTNSLILFWGASLLILVLAFLARRRMKQVPTGVQNFFEVIVDFLGGIADNLSPKARRFLGAAFVLFVVVLFMNWSGLLPVVGSIGRVETAYEWLEHRIHDREAEIQKDESLAGLSADEQHYLAIVDSLEANADQTFVAFDGNDSFAYIPFGRGQNALVPFDAIIDYEPETLDEIQAVLTSGEHLEGELADAFHDLEETLKATEVRRTFTNDNGTEYDFTGRTAGLLVPYLRGPSTDLTITLTFALFAVAAIQFFGFSSLGFRGYGSKFISIRKGPIWSFVGLLELIGEVARLVSFAFRLFGNLFAGEVLLFVMAFLLPLIGIIPFLGLEVFVGMVQAFIMATLVLIFSHVASQSHDDH